MTLATILLVCLFCSPAVLPNAMLPPGQQASQTPETKPSEAPAVQETQNPPAPSETPKPQETKPSAAGKGSKAPTKAHSRRKKTVNTNCAVPAGNATATQGDSSAAANGSNVGTTPVNCPPPKKIVRNGGTSSPSIELGGDTSAHDEQKRATTQLMSTIDENLKKLTGRQLTSNQQETVNQIHQYVSQSKTALEAGDAERAHNLAVKARLLSDDLVKP